MFFRISIADFDEIGLRPPPFGDVREDMENNGRFVMNDRFYLMEGDLDIAYPKIAKALVGHILVETMNEEEVPDSELIEILIESGFIEGGKR